MNVFNQFQLCGCGGTVFQNGGGVTQTRIDQSVLNNSTTPASSRCSTRSRPRPCRERTGTRPELRHGAEPIRVHLAAEVPALVRRQILNGRAGRAGRAEIQPARPSLPFHSRPPACAPPTRSRPRTSARPRRRSRRTARARGRGSTPDPCARRAPAARRAADRRAAAPTPGCCRGPRAGVVIATLLGMCRRNATSSWPFQPTLPTSLAALPTVCR